MKIGIIHIFFIFIGMLAFYSIMHFFSYEKSLSEILIRDNDYSLYYVSETGNKKLSIADKNQFLRIIEHSQDIDSIPNGQLKSDHYFFIEKNDTYSSLDIVVSYNENGPLYIRLKEGNGFYSLFKLNTSSYVEYREFLTDFD